MTIVASRDWNRKGKYGGHPGQNTCRNVVKPSMNGEGQANLFRKRMRARRVALTNRRRGHTSATEVVVQRLIKW